MDEDDKPVAGPSNPRTCSRPPSPTATGKREKEELFLPPPAVAASASQERLSNALRSTHDLLQKFRLVDAYDRYVRGEEVVDKGKGKETDNHDDTAAKKNNYKHLIKGTPGKHSMKKDDYLATIIQVPPKQRMRIVPFDQKTQREAFTVSLEGLKGWNANTLILESAQAREDRRKRKELKKLAKQQAQQASPIQAPIPQSSSSSSFRPTSSTPQPVGTPRAASTPVARPASTKSPVTPVVGTPVRTSTPHPLSAPPLSADPTRGKKREREDTVPPINGSALPTQTNGVQPVTVIGAKAGIGTARPRPVKKQRVDIQGQARDTIPIQQPTPH